MMLRTPTIISRTRSKAKSWGPPVGSSGSGSPKPELELRVKGLGFGLRDSLIGQPAIFSVKP